MDVTSAYRASRDQLLSMRGDYRRAVAEFQWPQLGDRFNWAVDWFDAIARGNDRPALAVVEEDGSAIERSFDEMARASDRLASWLASNGVVKGDPVLLMLGNQVELWESMLAIMKLGAVVLPTTTAVTAADVAERIARSGARHLICKAADTARLGKVPGEFTRISVGQADGWADLREAATLEWAPIKHPRTSVDDPVLLYFTSGTTSRPKLVEHTQVSYPVGHLPTMYFLGILPGDVHLNISSPGWAKHAWSCFFAPWIAEATVFVYNYSRFDSAALLGQIRAREVNSFCAPPTVWRMLIKAELGERPAGLREAVGAGEPLNPEVIEQVRRAWGLTIRDGFGQTETTAQVGNVPGAEVKPGSMGRPLPGVPVVLVDVGTHKPLIGPGEGEICLELARRPLSLMKGYQSDPERTAEAMAGGYYHTGDVATIDSEGYIFYVGRTDDVFKASDYKISPFELESVLIEHPAVAEAAVVPAADPIRLAVPKAYIALAPGHEPTRETALSIFKHTRERLNPYQRVRRIEFSDLPKTLSGKIRRVELRARENEPRPDEWRDDQFRSELS
ncbi:AMP-binding protein [Planotetraspora kaengkrachanensis]|uniref:AMP-dependent synthetase n=1 Tax=Planotetraspora kaengkrachanensis TaxID=575193 RepID=A0A8J3PS54_9ACTN|nr:AMP-binding protein [Planotetraspora kaengkrachanensis]GIG78618.1 AMP-dependent synthetase [Planotetraspora kaengkrachanensis]